MKYLVIKQTYIKAFDSKKEANEFARGKNAFSEAIGDVTTIYTVEEVEE